MKSLALSLAASLLLAGCTFGDKFTEANPIEAAARDTHSAYLRSDSGFGLDSRAPIFYESFEETLPTRWLGTAPTGTSLSDAWSTSTTRSNFGLRSLTYGAAGVINRATEFGEALYTTKEAVSLVNTTEPVLVFFALFDQQGGKDEQTAFKVELSQDLGFNWEPLKPAIPEGATDSVIAAPETPAREWTRYRYDLRPYIGQAIRVRFSLKASMTDRKLLYLDDLLIAENRK